MNRDEHLADGVATALLAGLWTPPQMSRRVTIALGRQRAPDWVTALVGEVATAYRDPPRDRPRELAAYLPTTRAWGGIDPYARVRNWSPRRTEAARMPWPVTPLPDLGALARLLDVDQGELAWFADVRGLERSCALPLRHYTWRQIRNSRGGRRLIAAPKPRLKEIQRRLLRHVLDPIPAHDAAHGGVPGRSVRTATEPHAGATVVIRVDLTAFFASIPAGRVHGLLRVAGFPEAVAHVMTGLCTTVVPFRVSREPALAIPHLPAGAPSSPALANLVAFSLDRRLAGLARSYGAHYTRYVDDLVLSGGPSLRAARRAVVDLVRTVVTDEGFAVNDRKTVVLGAAGRQQVLGTVVNAHPAVCRPERDRLRAQLHNCAVHGWPSQAHGRTRDELRAHLLGRIAWIGSVHPAHGRRLQLIAERIDWLADQVAAE